MRKKQSKINRKPDKVKGKKIEDLFISSMKEAKAMRDDFRNEGGLRMKKFFKINDQFISKKKSPPPIYFDKKLPLITIITVVYNGEKFLEKTILSVINQTYSNIEYIIIDGGSTDRTLDIIRKYEHAIDYWISEIDEGIYHAMNKGIVLATGKWLNFMNADDYFVHADVIRSIKLDDKFEFIYGNIIIKDEDYEIKSGSEVNLKIPIYKSLCFHQAVFAKKKLYIKFDSFRTDLKIASDYDFFVKVFNNKISVKYVDYCVAVMRVGGVSSKFITASINEKLKIVKENYDLIYYIKAVFYSYIYEWPRNYIRLILYRFNLIKYWRKIRDY